ncbi:MAG: HEPN domain-containing protein [Candidatus Aenigmatarchaeota archaeon]
MEIKELLKKGYLSKIPVCKELIEKELKEAKYDLERAKVAIEQNDFKWAIIKSYYAMFHSARALLFSMGLKERRHFAVAIFLEKLSKDGKLESRYVDDFRAAMACREDADYRYVYSIDTANYIIELAEEFLSRIKKLIK